jgi:hypothetical protein
MVQRHAILGCHPGQAWQSARPPCTRRIAAVPADPHGPWSHANGTEQAAIVILAIAIFAAVLVIVGAIIGILAVLAAGIRRQDNSGRLDESQGRAAMGARAINGLHTGRYAVVERPGYRDDLPVPAETAGQWR